MSIETMTYHDRYKVTKAMTVDAEETSHRFVYIKFLPPKYKNRTKEKIWHSLK